MGRSSRHRVDPPTRESFHLGVARARYLRGDIGIEEFEELVAHVLRGGILRMNGERYPDDPLFEPPEMSAAG